MRSFWYGFRSPHPSPATIRTMTVMATQTRHLIPPKNMATATSGKNVAAVPKSGCTMMSPTGMPIINITRMNDRKSRKGLSYESKNLASISAVKIFMNSDG